MHLFSKKAAKKMAAYQKELIETHYQEVDNMYRQMRGWRHDYRNHIQTMKAYAAIFLAAFFENKCISISQISPY